QAEVGEDIVSEKLQLTGGFGTVKYCNAVPVPANDGWEFSELVFKVP
ncbi:MAG: hypothetical protein IH591_09375, partial [Bacteroidales bacterium]|nr:hypothetical protein [Bacteroidales bacterium]